MDETTIRRRVPLLNLRTIQPAISRSFLHMNLFI
jgi:hypothetical protein